MIVDCYGVHICLHVIFFVSKLYPKETRRRVHIFNKIFVQIYGDIILVVASIVMKKYLSWHQGVKCLVILFVAAIYSCSSTECQDNSFSALS